MAGLSRPKTQGYRGVMRAVINLRMFEGGYQMSEIDFKLPVGLEGEVVGNEEL